MYPLKKNPKFLRRNGAIDLLGPKRKEQNTNLNVTLFNEITAKSQSTVPIISHTTSTPISHTLSSLQLPALSSLNIFSNIILLFSSDEGTKKEIKNCTS